MLLLTAALYWIMPLALACSHLLLKSCLTWPAEYIQFLPNRMLPEDMHLTGNVWYYMHFTPFSILNFSSQINPKQPLSSSHLHVTFIYSSYVILWFCDWCDWLERTPSSFIVSDFMKWCYLLVQLGHWGKKKNKTQHTKQQQQKHKKPTT